MWLAVLLLLVIGLIVLDRKVFKSDAARPPVARQPDGAAHVTADRSAPDARSSAPDHVDLPSAATAARDSAMQAEIDRRVSWYAGLLARYAAQGKDAQKLTAALTARWKAIADFVAVARAQGFDERRGNLSLKYVELKGAALTRIDADLRAAIGDEDFQELQRYEEKLPERAVAAELARRLSAAGDPIDPAVQDRVAEMLFVSREPTGERKEVGHAAVPDSDLPPFSERIIPAAVFDRLDGTLTPQQLRVLQRIYHEQQRRGHFANPRS